MHAHSADSANVAERCGLPKPAVAAVRHHHERWDGKGYPEGLARSQIPVLARILTDRSMQSTPLGITALACAALGDATAWCLLAIVVARPPRILLKPRRRQWLVGAAAPRGRAGSPANPHQERGHDEHGHDRQQHAPQQTVALGEVGHQRAHALSKASSASSSGR